MTIQSPFRRKAVIFETERNFRVTIPNNFLRYLNWKPDDKHKIYVDITADPIENVIIIKKEGGLSTNRPDIIAKKYLDAIKRNIEHEKKRPKKYNKRIGQWFKTLLSKLKN